MIEPAVRAYFSLGSNLGDRLDHLARAVRALAALPVLRVVAVSPVYETAPIGPDGVVVDDQSAFLNCALSADVRVGAGELRELTAGIERSMGRPEHGRWESRTIDIDLLLHGGTRVSTPSVTVPHPRIGERAFVLRPLVDLEAGISVPGLGRLSELLPGVADQGCVLHTDAEKFRRLIGEGTGNTRDS